MGLIRELTEAKHQILRKMRNEEENEKKWLHLWKKDDCHERYAKLTELSFNDNYSGTHCIIPSKEKEKKRDISCRLSFRYWPLDHYNER